MIEFILNHEVVRLNHERADLTVLEYLREQRQLCGTKEGCASGDCGACTVVVAEVLDNQLSYQSCNSCITFLGALHGKQLVTVEHLEQDGRLHPVQQAMVVHHGSQCGFCTPGFVMSLFAMYKNPLKRASMAGVKAATEEYLGGNLCRCTGYKPIVQAALEGMQSAPEDHFSRSETAIIETLKRLKQEKNPGTENFYLPSTCQGLAELCRQMPAARMLAGGTDLALEVTQQLRTVDPVIYLGNIPALRKTKVTDDFFEVGAAVSLSRLNDLVEQDYPDLSGLLLRFGSRQVRNLGSVGGNIANASPIGDLPPVLIALGAELTLQSFLGRRQLSIEDFFTDYRKTRLSVSEFIRSVRFPRAVKGRYLKVYKVSKRIDDDISAVCTAICIELDHGRVGTVRIGVGGMSAIPKRAIACETALRGSPFDAESVERAREALLDDFQPIDDVRASAKYRMAVAQNLLSRLFIELNSPETPTRVYAHG